MAKTRTEITRDYQKKCDAIMLRPSLENGQRYRQAAASAGMSVQKFFFTLAEEYIAKHTPAEEDIAPPWESEET